MYKAVGTLVAVSLSMAGRIAMMQYLKPPALPPIQLAAPNGTPLPGGMPLPQLQPMVSPLPGMNTPVFSFPSPSTILGQGPAPAPARSNARREAARSGSRTPYSPAKSLRGTARPSPRPVIRPAGSAGNSTAPPGR
jgi:hypothetical protein